MSDYTPEPEIVRTMYAKMSARLGRADNEDARAEFDRWLNIERREARAEGMRQAASVTASKAAEEWRLDSGEGMPGGISKIGAQSVAQSLELVTKIIYRRAENIQDGEDQY